MPNRNYPYYELPQIESYVDLIQKKVTEKPDGVAFAWYKKDELQTVTCRVFTDTVCAIAGKIKEKHGQGKHLGIIGANSYDWLVIYMAVIFSGNVIVVLDKDMLLEEISDCVERMDISFLFSDNATVGKCRELGEKTGVRTFEDCKNEALSAEEGGETAGTGSYDIEDFNVGNVDDVCSIFMTSGTTGKRKGVMLTHRNIAADINESCKLFELTGDTLAVLPFHHAFGLIVAVWMVLHYGHTVYISQGMRRIKKELALVKPQTMMLVPLFVETFHKQIRKAVKSENKEKKVVRAMQLSNLLCKAGIDMRRKWFHEILDSFGGDLEYIICGGAALDERYVKDFRSFGVEILNGYGTTECAPVAAVNRNHYHRDGTVGLPLPNTEVKISPEGEIMIRGDHVMAGYYHEPEATEAVLEDGWYYSGDLGEIDKDGFIRITGRKKNLIILSSGENISPEELEERLLRIEGIDEVVVRAAGNELAAEIYSKDADDGTVDLIRKEIDEMNKSVPMYKRITQVTFRSEEFPKTTSKKIIRG